MGTPTPRKGIRSRSKDERPRDREKRNALDPNMLGRREMAVKRPTYAKDGFKSVSTRGCIIEFIATMTYVALCVPSQMKYGEGFSTAMVYGTVVALLTYAFRKETVVQMNPSVSVAFMATGKITVEQMVANVVSQLAGALIGVCWTCIFIGLAYFIAFMFTGYISGGMI